MTSAAAVRRRTRVDKFEERRRELADAALLALADLGYARTSLRTIAEHTKFSHGLLHYYFADKVELITYCVRRYKAACVQRYEGGVGEVATPAELAAACADGLAAALADAPLMHRLWYDLRSQSMFEEAFRDDVAEIDDSLQDMIWRNVSAYADLAGTPPNCSPSEAYALFDGLFQQALLRYLMSTEGALDDLRNGVRALFPRLLSTED
ncbi:MULTISPECIES: TetR/AcrR family transcriptional regulator [unclassified Amycolatopsis]|uniref:TetR/AcrR family transcriptional regulator n=1 Tax=unclassified Amycolatopsis TaxID=2618356 RepID=UPI002E143A0C|nr:MULTISPECIES: TetR/AcrR family transcriptional regulator [unclassified Amycolatopsis]WSJ76990.1 TetR/AcrR family transcriptional regulator [Amycolatopsis sp. NBC_01307]WSK79460.1 TetR/AcrR family transcriptional regulator [Amycolatopsis sp. NBC_01286]